MVVFLGFFGILKEELFHKTQILFKLRGKIMYVKHFFGSFSENFKFPYHYCIRSITDGRHLKSITIRLSLQRVRPDERRIMSSFISLSGHGAFHPPMDQAGTHPRLSGGALGGLRRQIWSIHWCTAAAPRPKTDPVNASG